MAARDETKIDYEAWAVDHAVKLIREDAARRRAQRSRRMRSYALEAVGVGGWAGVAWAGAVIGGWLGVLEVAVGVGGAWFSALVGREARRGL